MMVLQTLKPIMIVITTIAKMHGGLPVDRQEAVCLTENVYFEAGWDEVPVYEKQLVAKTAVMTARKKGITVCEEVYRDARYSWVKENKSLAQVTSNELELKAWKQAAEIAVITLADENLKWEGTHFHDYSVSPYWIDGMQELYNGEKFAFYKEK